MRSAIAIRCLAALLVLNAPVAGASDGRRAVPLEQLDGPVELIEGEAPAAVSVTFPTSMGTEGTATALTFRYGPVTDAGVVSSDGLVVRLESDAVGVGRIVAAHKGRMIAGSPARRMRGTVPASAIVTVDADGDLTVSHFAADEPLYPIWKKRLAGWAPSSDWRAQFVAEPGGIPIRALLPWSFAATSPGRCGDGAADPGEQCDLGPEGCRSPCCTNDCRVALRPTTTPAPQEGTTDVCPSRPSSDTGTIAVAKLLCRLGQRSRASHDAPMSGRITVSGHRGDQLLDMTLPAGAYDRVLRAGWKSDRRGDLLYKAAFPDDGLAKLKVDLRPSRQVARVKLVTDRAIWSGAPEDGRIFARLRLDGLDVECCGTAWFYDRQEPETETTLEADDF